ncbi:hypothetical protein BKA70DRAFT_1316592 [Coprinopsis sp. MPI-PUGE-AT-0042]|nr:hypothetical protein BKA70DRAFT_1316592 [Coprinopsis sp. MPI-PUGE-AT-0042]
MDPMLTDDAMAPAAFGEPEPEPELLSYDDTVPYEDQVQPESEATSLANRIGRGKIYLLEDAAPAAGLKRKAHGGEDEEVMMDEEGLDEDPEIRSNALFFTGPPIAHLPTTRIFAYATQFEAHPLGLEWVSDTTCVLVFSSKAEARKGYLALQKVPDEEPSLEDGSVTAKSIPVTLWPAEERITRTLGLALGAEDKERENERRKEGLAAPLRVRWARIDDVKKKGARNESEFYRKHGRLAGKELVNGRDMPSLPGDRKRRREDEDEEATRARLDSELDAFLAEESDEEGAGEKSNGRSLADRFSTVAEAEEVEDETELPASPPSKMRSDYIGEDGRSVLRKRDGRRQGGRQSRQLGSRIVLKVGGSAMERVVTSAVAGGASATGYKVPGRARVMNGVLNESAGEEKGMARDENEDREAGEEGVEMMRVRERGGGGGSSSSRGARPKKTQQELDDELDAFLAQA